MEDVKKSEKYSCVATCPMRNVIAHFANKWSMLLLVILDEFGVMRFNELSRAIPDISPKVLSGHLKTLEAIGLVKRVLYAEVPPRVEYDLTGLGMTLIPILDELSEWGREHLDDVSGNLAKKAVD
ncbi:helix-turn-helix domain-containing protein [Duncaniella dubosii]|uniref:winged helix-turn-helix transcriptional regulator n=1 Tax=Duncaniella dubosii TaxID=2518971 RepID=UPI000E9DE770|nr:helix-turn-helix domain-containing protein [uncultured Duncaniella sp.]HBN64822.1 transcriptional regulator [Porphyromonadaceae bacterium]